LQLPDLNDFIFNLKPPLWWRNRKGLTNPELIILIITFLNVKESNQKKPPVSRFFLRVDAPAGARGNSLCSDSPRAQSVRRADARRGTKGFQTEAWTMG
jgi:hypothetical protein